MKKLSFFERLTGTIRMQDDSETDLYQDHDDEDAPLSQNTLLQKQPQGTLRKISPLVDETYEEEIDDGEAELAVDVFQNDR